MKYILLTLLFILQTACQSGSKKAVQNSETVSEKVIFSGKEVRKYKLSHGGELIAIHDASLPRVGFSVFFKFGAQQDPQHLEGVTSLMAALVDRGTQTRSSEKLADDFAALGSNFNASVNIDYTGFEASTLSTKAPQLFELVFDVLTKPTFTKSEFAKVKDQFLVAAQRRGEDPSSFADQKLDEFIYPNHPYGREVNGTEKSLAKIKLSDVQNQYKNFFVPENMTFIIVGKFDALFENMVKVKLETWSANKSAALSWLPPEEAQGIQWQFLNKKGAKQSEIRIGQMGLARRDPDFIAMRLANTILGGGFQSRLNQRVRDDLGLTYAVYSAIEARKERGPFSIATFTRHPMLRKTLDETLNVFNQFVQQGANEEELKAAKNLLKGQFPRAIETADKLAFNLFLLNHYGVSESYLTEFNQRVDQVNLGSLNAAIRKHMKPENLRIFILSDKEVVQDQLKDINNIQWR